MTVSKAPPGTTVLDIQKSRRDLEKRLLIDILQFEVDNGVLVDHIDLTRVRQLGHDLLTLTDVEIRLEFPR